MEAILKLNDWGTRAVLSRYGLTASRRLGKGTFCAVYEDGPDQVFKLTADSIQLESVRDYLVGVHFPKLLANEGCVGEQFKGDRSLFLFKSERLKRTREADAATRKLTRQVLKAVDECWSSKEATNKSHLLRGTFAAKQSMRSSVALEQLIEKKDLPESVREAFEDIQRMVMNYNDLALDFHGANLMVRGTDELVFNDIIVDGALLYGDLL